LYQPACICACHLEMIVEAATMRPTQEKNKSENKPAKELIKDVANSLSSIWILCLFRKRIIIES